MPGLNPDCLHSLDVEQITASFLQAFARQRERLRQERQQQELRRHRQLVRRRQERLRRVRVRVQQLELVQVLRQERVREQALLLFCHKR